MDKQTVIDLALLPAVISDYLPLGRSGLLPALQAAQRVYGWLPLEVTREIGQALHVPLADVFGVVEFYSTFYTEPVGKNIIRVCTDPACALKGADQVLTKLNAYFSNSSKDELSTTVEKSTCLGLCEHAPAVMLNEDVITFIAEDPGKITSKFPTTRVYGNNRLLTKLCGNGKPASLKDHGGYAGFQQALKLSPEAVITEIKAAGLVGRGGAAFPTGVKWDGARTAPGEQKYVICNADESEPGTFKDRVLLCDDPHSIIEGMRIAAYAIGASHGYIYLRGEYSYIAPNIESALTEAREAGFLDDLFDIELRIGAGAYICGEETALFESIEGKRGFPRVKPPFPTTHGLFGLPTVINNVETLCNIPLIMEMGASRYRQLGTEKSPGPKLFCISGDVSLPGLYEAPFGITLREILGMAGGIKDGHILQAILVGGAAGAFATPNLLDVRLTFEDLRASGLPLGSGVIMVFDHTRDLRDTLKRLGHFFAHESCGKCYPCQLGTQRQTEILDRLATGKIIQGDRERLLDVGLTMTDASLCGLGQTAASAIVSAIKQFPALFNPDQFSKYSEIVPSQNLVVMQANRTNPA